MTGYGHAVRRTDDFVIEIVIKSYNNRYLDISKNLSFPLAPFETLVDSRVKEIASRGHIEVSGKLHILRSSVRVNVDEGLLDEYTKAFALIEGRTGVRPTLSDYIAVDGLVSPDSELSSDIYLETFTAALDEALAMLSAEKDREGEGTKRDLEKLGNEFASSLAAIEKRSGDLEAHYRKLLEEKYLALTGEKAGSSDFMAELGAILVRYSINEEVSRLGVHIAEYRKLLESADPCGKRLDFLCQEMQRECNTIASKSQLADINLLVVRMKDNIENIREQIRNIE